MKRPRASLRASALLLVLWALLVLSGAVFMWGAAIQRELTLHGEEQRAGEARIMARSGLAVALDPAVSRQTPLPPETISPGQGYEVRLSGEGGRLNLAWLLRGEEPAKLNLLKLWLEQRGLNMEQRERFVDSLLDYVDADNLQRLNGSEDRDGYHPANRELRSLDELTRIPGTAPLTTQAGWQDSLTLYSLGPIDLDAAGADILRLLPGLSETRLQKFLEFRRGPDGLEHTRDDGIFPDLTTLRQFLGLSPEQFQSLGALISYRDPTLRAVSVGHSGEVTRQAAVVYRKGTGPSAILFWQEP